MGCRVATSKAALEDTGLAKKLPVPNINKIRAFQMEGPDPLIASSGILPCASEPPVRQSSIRAGTRLSARRQSHRSDPNCIAHVPAWCGPHYTK